MNTHANAGGVSDVPTSVEAALILTDFAVAFPRKRLGAGLLVVDAENRILLVEPTYKDHWEIPGGLVEEGESPRNTARREAKEEFDLDIEVGRLIVIDWVAPGLLPDDGIMFLYTAEPFDTAQIKLPANELLSWKWCDREEVRARVPDFMARRLEAALVAMRTGQVLELENGVS